MLHNTHHSFIADRRHLVIDRLLWKPVVVSSHIRQNYICMLSLLLVDPTNVAWFQVTCSLLQLIVSNISYQSTQLHQETKFLLNAIDPATNFVAWPLSIRDVTPVAFWRWNADVCAIVRANANSASRSECVVAEHRWLRRKKIRFPRQLFEKRCVTHFKSCPLFSTAHYVCSTCSLNPVKAGPR